MKLCNLSGVESDAFSGDFMVKLFCRLPHDSITDETYYGDFMVKLIWRLSGNLIYHVSE